MSIYISINGISLTHKPTHALSLLVQSQQAVLRGSIQPPSLHPHWPELLISSVKQPYLIFGITHAHDEDNVLAEASLDISSLGLRHKHQVKFEHKLDLLSHQISQGTMVVEIQYQRNKKYLGEIEFYEVNEETTRDMRVEKKNQKLNTSLESEMRVKEIGSRLRSELDLVSTEGKKNLNFYKGPCKTKNLFSCLDESLSNQSFHFVEDNYK